MNVREALKRMVGIAVSARKMDMSFRNAGYHENPFWDIYGEAMDAIYALIGEKTNTIDEAVTYHVINDDSYTNDERVDLLVKEYERNEMHDKQGNGG